MTSPYGTHLYLLQKVLAVTEGPILELGIGEHSTPVLHQFALKGRKVVSYDSDQHYIQTYADKYRHPSHIFHWVSEWDAAEIERHWSVALIDHRPARRRYRDAARLAHYAEYVVCHDTEPEIDRFYKYDRAFKHFEHRFDDALRPRTTVLSNFHSLDWLKEGEHL